jgi:thiamine-phosphate pyrophosphorylase
VKLPHLYAIIDTAVVPNPVAFARELVAGGVTLIQYRNKQGSAREMLSHARELKRVLPQNVQLIMNDRADLCLAADFGGVHVGQGDLSVEGARRVCGLPLIVGVSTHNLEQVALANESTADYVAFGPVFATRSKENPAPVVGLEGIRAARAMTRKPLVAIGGITRENGRDVMAAGADAVAVISELISEPREAAEEILARLAS